MFSIERLGLIMIGLPKDVNIPFLEVTYVFSLLGMLLCFMFCAIARVSVHSALFVVLYASFL